MFSGEVPERPAGPGPRGDGPRDRALHHRGGGMIEFGGAFLALKVIPQAATAGARAAGALQVGSRRTCGRNSLYPRVVPRDATGATRFAPPSCEVRRRRVHKPSIQISRGRRVQRQSATGGSQGREPAKPGRSRVVSRQPKTNIWDARRRGPAGKSGVQDAVSRRPAPHARGGRVVYDRVHYPRDRRVDAPTLGRYSEPSFFLDRVPPVVVRLARQREPPPTWEQGWQPREVADATVGTLRWAGA